MVSKVKVTNQAFSDLEILDWMDKNGHCVFCVGRVWYWKAGYGKPHHRAKSLREAVINAMNAQSK